jgi:uncharacterized lipoprotein YmbA
MAMRVARWLGVALLVAAAGGCGTSAPPRFYTLESTATAHGSPAAGYGVMVGPVSVPASVDRPEFVVQIAPNRVEVDEFNRWVAPLGESIARTVAGDLVVLLGTPDVAVAPFANFDPVYRVTINVQRFDSVPGDRVLIDAVWVVHRIEGGTTRSGRTVAGEPALGEGFDALAAAHSRALARLSAHIAGAIRAASDAP